MPACAPLFTKAGAGKSHSFMQACQKVWTAVFRDGGWSVVELPGNLAVIAHSSFRSIGFASPPFDGFAFFSSQKRSSDISLLRRPG